MALRFIAAFCEAWYPASNSGGLASDGRGAGKRSGTACRQAYLIAAVASLYGKRTGCVCATIAQACMHTVTLIDIGVVTKMGYTRVVRRRVSARVGFNGSAAADQLSVENPIYASLLGHTDRLRLMTTKLKPTREVDYLELQYTARMSDKDPPRRDGGFGGGGGRGPGGPGQGRRPEGAGARGPRRDGPGARGPGQGGGYSRDDRRDQGERREPPQPLPEIIASVIPDEKGVESMARQVKMTGRAFPLFDIAFLVIQKPERYSIRFATKKNAQGQVAQPLFHCALDETVWLSEDEAVAHVLQKHFATFYQADKIQAEAPKGVYTFVGQCGLSGVILGPPNYHDYQTKLRKLHAERFARIVISGRQHRVRRNHSCESIGVLGDEARIELGCEFRLGGGGGRQPAARISSGFRRAALPSRPYVRTSACNRYMDSGR